MKLAALSSALCTALDVRLPLWQALLLGSTTYLASQLLRRTLHTTAATLGKKRSSKKETLLEPFSSEDTKLVLIVRTDLGMSKGKIAA
ncbi:hypothetical protein J3B02_005119, partial [Coemansia erecta]